MHLKYCDCCDYNFEDEKFCCDPITLVLIQEIVSNLSFGEFHSYVYIVICCC